MPTKTPSHTQPRSLEKTPVTVFFSSGQRRGQERPAAITHDPWPGGVGCGREATWLLCGPPLSFVSSSPGGRHGSQPTLELSGLGDVSPHPDHPAPASMLGERERERGERQTDTETAPGVMENRGAPTRPLTSCVITSQAYNISVPQSPSLQNEGGGPGRGRGAHICGHSRVGVGQAP